jgi:hypothetical protein
MLTVKYAMAILVFDLPVEHRPEFERAVQRIKPSDAYWISDAEGGYIRLRYCRRLRPVFRLLDTWKKWKAGIIAAKPQ